MRLGLTGLVVAWIIWLIAIFEFGFNSTEGAIISVIAVIIGVGGVIIDITI